MSYPGITAKFQHIDIPFVIGLGDSVMVKVWRSLVVDPSDRRMALINAHIEEHGMVLHEREVKPSDKSLYGRVEESLYLVPEARNLLLQFPDGESSDG